MAAPLRLPGMTSTTTRPSQIDHAQRTWLRRFRSYASRIVLLLLALLIGALGMRAWMSRSAPDLKAWHRMVPEELDVRALAKADWAAYVQAEDRIFKDLIEEMGDELDAEDRVQFNRYNPDSPVCPDRLSTNWNRSFVLEPRGAPTGVVLLLHGMTDSPYSMRPLAQDYQRRGFVAFGLRLPAHGTVPGALTRIDWRQWIAAVQLGMREAAKRSQGTLPLHIVGYSNGGALAVKYALDALEDASLARPDRIVLLSPMIGVNRNARFAGIAGWPAILPAFARTAWLDIVPEFNPFKYNSFPVNAARQSYLLTDSLQKQLMRLEASDQLEGLPPILTFQSMVDATVIASAVASTLYAQLPANGSELVLFDINRDADISPFLRGGVLADPATMLSAPPRNYGVTIVTNAAPHSRAVIARTVAAGERDEVSRPLDLMYPPEVFSLSHIALPFPLDDPLYGLTPNENEDFGIRLGTLGMRGERGVLAAGLDSTTVRLSSNPFFPYMLERIEAQ